jgi:hypothetical protein
MDTLTSRHDDEIRHRGSVAARSRPLFDPALAGQVPPVEPDAPMLPGKNADTAPPPVDAPTPPVALAPTPKIKREADGRFAASATPRSASAPCLTGTARIRGVPMWRRRSSSARCAGFSIARSSRGWSWSTTSLLPNARRSRRAISSRCSASSSTTSARRPAPRSMGTREGVTGPVGAVGGRRPRDVRVNASARRETTQRAGAGVTAQTRGAVEVVQAVGPVTHPPSLAHSREIVQGVSLLKKMPVISAKRQSVVTFHACFELFRSAKGPSRNGD